MKEVVAPAEVKTFFGSASFVDVKVKVKKQLSQGDLVIHAKGAKMRVNT